MLCDNWLFSFPKIHKSLSLLHCAISVLSISMHFKNLAACKFICKLNMCDQYSINICLF
jgi:hypothetical protein